ncbi:MAG TPA: alginate export family protein [Moraxellaceae bacterium]|nr:alginate export family protein [Moraxellaceae bacterium]
MKKWIYATAAIAAQSFVTTSAHADPMEVALLQEAIFSGKTSLELRMRNEYVDYETTPETDVTTLRSVLGYKTGDYHGLKAYLEFENVSALDNADYNSGTTGAGNKKTQYGLIADPTLTQVNQSYLEGYGFKAGRQKIIYDNARFIGDSGWRQNDQTFDAVSFSNSTWVKDLTLNAAYVSRVNNIYGVTRVVDAPLANVRYAAFPQARVSAFYYGVQEDTAPTTSWQHTGFRADGAIADFLYELSYADQSAYADATEKTVPDSHYTDVQLGYKFGPVTVKAEREVLAKGFKTPLATLHAFNGWADRFLTTPANGLQDTNLQVFATVADYNFVAAYHDFREEMNSSKYGDEVDFSVSKPLTSKLTGLIKYAEFNGADVPGFTNDTRKAWLQFSYKM